MTAGVIVAWLGYPALAAFAGLLALTVVVSGQLARRAGTTRLVVTPPG